MYICRTANILHFRGLIAFNFVISFYFFVSFEEIRETAALNAALHFVSLKLKYLESRLKFLDDVCKKWSPVDSLHILCGCEDYCCIFHTGIIQTGGVLV